MRDFGILRTGQPLERATQTPLHHILSMNPKKAALLYDDPQMGAGIALLDRGILAYQSGKCNKIKEKIPTFFAVGRGR